MSLQWYSYSGIETRETLDLAKNAADGVIYSYPQYNPADALFDSFQDKYRSSYHTWADIYTVTSFDAIKLLSQVMSKSGTSSEQLQQGLRSQKGYKGIFGDVQFTEKQCVEPPLMWKIIKDGKYRLNP
jgi:branched-chain amino acid transport system substrate-binding protein